MIEKNELNMINDQAIYTFLDENFGGYVSIDLNYAIISIEQLMATASDRGRFKVLADHKAEFCDKCYIDSSDGFPRYYFNHECMMKELRSWINARKYLEIEQISLTIIDHKIDIKEYIEQRFEKFKDE